MYDAWTVAGVGIGSGALTWLAAGRATPSGEHTLRLSLDKNGSLLGDVRFLGGTLAWVASMYTKGQTKTAMQTVAAASLFSLLQMAKTSAALAVLGELRIPFISVLTDPTRQLLAETEADAKDSPAVAELELDLRLQTEIPKVFSDRFRQMRLFSNPQP